MGAATRIAAKDLKLRVRDRSALIIGIVAPLALAFIFNLVFGGAVNGSGLDLSYGLVDLDGSEVSTAFAGILADIEDGGLATVADYDDRSQAEQSLDAGDIDAFFVIGPGFGQSITRGGSGEIEVVGDVDAPTSTQIAASIAEQFATGLETTSLAIVTAAEALGAPFVTPDVIAGFETDPATAAFSFDFADVSADTRQLDPTTYFAAGMAVFFLFFTVQFGVSGLLEEEREGTLARLFAAPIGRPSVVLGKALLSFALGVISMTVLIVATQLLMGASWGPPLGVALLVLAGVGSAVGIMGVVASVARSPEGAGNVGSIIAVILGMLGGVFFPIGQGQDLLSRLTFLTPHAWFMRGLGDLAGDAGWTAALPAVGALSLFAITTAGAAWWLLSRRLAR